MVLRNGYLNLNLDFEVQKVTNANGRQILFTIKVAKRLE